MLKTKILGETLSWAVHIAVAVAIALLITHFVLQRTVVYNYSMEPTLKEGDSLCVDKLSPRLSNIHRGDIVIIYAPEIIEEKGHSLIKRVIAVENDLVEIKDGKVYINGKELHESYINGDYTSAETGEYAKLTIPKNHVYVLGDNRSKRIVDSRTMGPIDQKRITGKAFFRVYPFNKIGLLKR